MTTPSQTVPGSIESYARERNHILDLADQIADLADALPAPDSAEISWRQADALKRIRLGLSEALEQMNAITF